MMEEKILVKSEKSYLFAFLFAWGIPEVIGIILYLIDEWDEDAVIMYGIFLVPLVCGCFAVWMFSNVELAITDRRAYGRASFGRRIDLPLDSITAIGMSFMKGIAITTASGSVKFGCIKNRDEIYEVVGKLLMERQTSKPVSNETSSVEDLKKYKELLDTGVISQEEFDAKKKQLLGV